MSTFALRQTYPFTQHIGVESVLQRDAGHRGARLRTGGNHVVFKGLGVTFALRRRIDYAYFVHDRCPLKNRWTLSNQEHIGSRCDGRTVTAEELFGLVDANRDYLKKWLPWLDFNRSAQDTEAFIKSVIEQYESGNGPQNAIFHDDVMCGVCGFHPIDRGNNIERIGYWLDEARCGKGIVTNAVRVLVEVGFREYKLNRIEIACATENYRSRAIPEKLEFKLEGVLREYECLYGRYVDCAIYSQLASEYALNQRLQGDAAMLRT